MWQRLLRYIKSEGVNVLLNSIAGKTAQNPSQYLQALHMVMALWASFQGSSPTMDGSFPPSNFSENSSYCHSEPSQIAPPKDVTSHYLPCSEYVGCWASLREDDPGLLVHFYTEIGECDPWSQGIGIERRGVQGAGPMRSSADPDPLCGSHREPLDRTCPA